MKTLFIVVAALELSTGVALTVTPSLVVSFLLGAVLDVPAALTVARVAGAALIALGVACWLARKDDQSQAATGLLAAMFLYNAAVAGLLAYAGLNLGLFGIGLWPAVVLHLAIFSWCCVCLWGKTMRAQLS
jgi:hypothetical protein